MLNPNGYDHEQRLPAPNGSTRPSQKRSKANGQDQGEAVHGELPIIRVVKGELPRVVDEAEGALLEADVPIFRRTDRLMRPVLDTVSAANGKKTTVVRLRPMCVASMGDFLAGVAKFQRFDERRGKWTNADPPKDVSATLLARDGKWRLSPISGVITTPTLRPDGSLL